MKSGKKNRRFAFDGNCARSLGRIGSPHGAENLLTQRHLLAMFMAILSRVAEGLAL
jgi:hypothetical protein